MQRLRTGFSTLMLALSIQAAAVVSAASASPEPYAWGFSDSDDFVFAGSAERQVQPFEADYDAPQQWSAPSAWTPAADDANAHIFMLLKHVAIDSDNAHHDFLLI